MLQASKNIAARGSVVQDGIMCTILKNLLTGKVSHS